MIIKNRYNKIVKISLVTKKEDDATIRDVIDYYSKYIKDSGLFLSGDMPFLFTDDRAIMRNIEIKTAEECFNIYYNKINMAQMSKEKPTRNPFRR